jgi:glutathione S-transferase
MVETPLLYTFRRCPYAMRARMALVISGTPVRVREVVLRDKPAAMLEASAKGTVPVLVLGDGTVIDESIDVMRWALAQNDPEGWLAPESDGLIAEADGPFKSALDRYKYSNRYEDEAVVSEEQRALGLAFLKDWDARLAAAGGQFFGAQRTLADVALFPFVRQFANTDRDWFDGLELPALQTWLAGHLDSELFTGVMSKYPQWAPGADEPVLAAV